MRIGDGSAWTFVNGAWHDGPEDTLVVPGDLVREEGSGMQGHHYAFLHEAEYGDLHVRFRFRLTPHSDAGIILHAANPSDFFVLHFPDCGQADRAQHFWVALSRMDGSGWMRIVSMDLVRRVSSTNGLWHEADAHLIGERLHVRIDGRGVFEVSDAGLRGYGRSGAYLFNRAELRDVSLEGREGPIRPWAREKHPPKRWFHPRPEADYGKWQRPGQVVRTPGGDLLLNYTVQAEPYRGNVTPLVSRSSDGGRTWAKPEPVAGLKVGAWEGWGMVGVFPDGVLRMLVPGETSCRRAESPDDGRTWTEPQPVALAMSVPGLKRVHPGPLVNLADGSVLMFGYGGHDSTVPGSSIFTWGSHHCRAFASRSTDGGKTWSEWANIDGTLASDGTPVDGNLDLTEVCGVEIGDGRILALVRPIYSPWMWETWSSDGGRTWTPCMRGPFPGYATSNMIRTASGAVLVAHRLPGCTVHTSLDDGLTWDRGTMIDSAIWCMGGMVEVQPDLVLYVYYDSFESLMRAQFIRVTPRGIVPGG